MDAFTRAWRVLEQHHQDTRHILLRDRFACEPDRFDRMHERLNGMLFDYSKNRLGEDTLQLLCNLADAAGLGRRMHDLRTGAKVNGSEGRAALHTALRLPDGADAVYVDGRDVLTVLWILHVVWTTVRTRGRRAGGLRILSTSA